MFHFLLKGNVPIPKDYLEWATTMYAYFGNQWAHLHLGPTWSVDDSSKDTTVDTPQLKMLECNQNCTKSEIGKTRSSNNVRNYPLYSCNIYFYASLKKELIFMF